MVHDNNTILIGTWHKIIYEPDVKNVVKFIAAPGTLPQRLKCIHLMRIPVRKNQGNIRGQM